MMRYLKFADRAEMLAALGAVGLLDGDGAPLVSGRHHALDVVGQLYSPLVQDEAGNVVSGGDALPGYHANLMVSDGRDLAALDNYTLAPANPHRVFWGQP